MALYVYWFLLALVLLGLEMATGTFYLLVLSVALAVGGIAALFGMDISWQFALAALAGVSGSILLRHWNPNPGCDVPNQSLDVGQPVRILRWNEQGAARVFYRGAEWDAELDANESGHEGSFYIKAVRGSTLLLSHQKQG